MENVYVYVLTSRYSDGSGASDVLRVYQHKEDAAEALEVAQRAGADLVKIVEVHPVPFVQRY